MKKRCISITIVLIMSFFATTGYCQDEKIRVYFGNGVFNDENDAELGLSALRLLLNKANIQGDLKDKLLCDISYNPTDGIMDLYEAVVQTHDLAWSSFWRILGGIEPMPDFMQDKLKIISARFDEDMVKSYPSIQKHIKKYNEDLCQGNKVVVVAHSQGNLYANIAYKGINENVIDGFGIVSVANPSWYVAGDSSNQFYTTIDEDIVVGFLPGALGSNVDNFSGLNSDDLSGHMFIDSYLAHGHEAESRILGHIITKIYDLEWPEGPCPSLLYIKHRINIAKPGSMSAIYSPDYCTVYDMESGKTATNVPLNGGGMATFPCLASNISDWKATKTLVGTPAVSGSHFYYIPKRPVTFDCDDPVCLDPETNLEYLKCTVKMPHQDNLTIGYSTWTGYDSENTYDFQLSYDWETVEDIVYKSLGNNSYSQTIKLTENISYNQFQKARMPGNGFVALDDITTVKSYSGGSPFSSESFTLTSTMIHDVSVSNSKDCFMATETNKTAGQLFRTDGIYGDVDIPYMVVFYTEELFTKQVTQPCYAGELTWKRSVQCSGKCTTIATEQYTAVIPFKIKAYSNKTNGDPADLNPFALNPDSGVKSALETLLEHVEDIHGSPEEGAVHSTYFKLQFLK